MPSSRLSWSSAAKGEQGQELPLHLTQNSDSGTDFRKCLFVHVRYEMLQETVSAYRREISALQDRNQRMNATAQRLEHAIYTMSQDLRHANEKLALEEVIKSQILIFTQNEGLIMFYSSMSMESVEPSQSTNHLSITAKWRSSIFTNY